MSDSDFATSVRIMNALIVQDSDALGRDDRKTTIWLVNGSDNLWRVESVIFENKIVGRRVSPRKKPEISDVFTPDFAEAIEDLLDENDDFGTAILRDWHFTSPYGIVHNAILSSSQTSDGGGRTMLRFNQNKGWEEAILLPDFRSSDDAGKYREQLALDVLVDCILPCLNFCQHVEMSKDYYPMVPAETKDNFTAKALELEFYMNLIKRHVSG